MAPTLVGGRGAGIVPKKGSDRTFDRFARAAPPLPSVSMKVLVAACAAALGVTAYMLADSWGGYSWVLDTVSGAVVCVLLLLRRRWSAAPAAVLAVALAAAVIARLADLP